MGQKNFAHGHAAMIIGVVLLFLGIIVYFIEANNIFGSTWIAWVLIAIGAIELIIGASALASHGSKDAEGADKDKKPEPTATSEAKPAAETEAKPEAV